MALSIVLMVVAVVGWGVAAGMEFMFLAFTDYCPPPRCSTDRAATAVLLSISVAAALTIIGCVVTIIRLVRRRPGWPYAIATLTAATVAELLGVVGYFAAVGY
ncbi:hypothetical protein [Mycobacterium stomatepiae]|uniref:Uncharacterized protein n=1 Tax=Mycobacterium stomatepiae TaxID=470076 RepID=A0A7I7Q5V2_9MYCO|nr:hypothetical protein [Mycobacterium stomatepiae]MCV7165737.1 hypothetical protein [Mycobacterium stomatepiae]BBY21734.1 hypothetical protein MSTO_19390 [Mycobacterium stomatepiae]